MNIGISFLGTNLDAHASYKEGRWAIWRPNVALHLQPDLKFDVFYLMYDPRFRGLYELICKDIQKASPTTQVLGVKILFEDAWDFEEVYTKLYDFTVREKEALAREDAEYYVHISTGTHVAQICLFLLVESHHLPGRLIQTRPMPPTVEEPGMRARGEYTVIDLDLSRYDLLSRRFEVERQEDLAFLKGGINTKNARFNHLIETIERVALRSTEPILLMGPTGAGKSQLARRIYELKKMTSPMRGPFVEVNCATLRGDQAISTLFGHKKGSFTGALADRPGLLKSADGGILFLDEVGELGLDEQAMLLRAIEDKAFLPLGSDTAITSSFQLICGTNRELLPECAAGRFRADLLARINLWTFSLPGLAERREDIEPNLEYELSRATEKSGKRITFNAEARQRFLEFALAPTTLWHGNFRDLNAMVIRMTTLASGGRIDVATVEEEIARTKQIESAAFAHNKTPPLWERFLGSEAASKIDEFDLVQLEHVLKVCLESASLSEAGKRLFAISRTQKKKPNDADRLGKYLARFGLSFAEIVGL